MKRQEAGTSVLRRETGRKGQKMTEEELRGLAGDAGFSETGTLCMESLRFRKEVREMCASGRCGKYGHCWTCPPYCGTLEESREKAAAYRSGFLVQTVGSMEDDFDYESIRDTEELHRKNFTAFVQRLRQTGLEFLPMTAGGCVLCPVCACPDAPCRFPDQAMVSMEAYGLLVNEVCRASGMKYSHGSRSITFTSCILYI